MNAAFNIKTLGQLIPKAVPLKKENHVYYIRDPKTSSWVVRYMPSEDASAFVANGDMCRTEFSLNAVKSTLVPLSDDQVIFKNRSDKACDTLVVMPYIRGPSLSECGPLFDQPDGNPLYQFIANKTFCNCIVGGYDDAHTNNIKIHFNGQNIGYTLLDSEIGPFNFHSQPIDTEVENLYEIFTQSPGRFPHYEENSLNFTMLLKENRLLMKRIQNSSNPLKEEWLERNHQLHKILGP